MNHSSRKAGLRRLPPLIAIALLAVAGPAPADAPRTEHVRTTDLDLSDPADLRVLQRRIDAAIEKVCVPSRSALLPNVRSRRAVRACREQALIGVQQQLQRHGVPAAMAARS